MEGGGRAGRAAAVSVQQAGADERARGKRVDLGAYLPGQLMTELDRTAMEVSLEARVPLLDLEAVRFSAGISPALRMKDGRPKYLLRRLLAGRMGDEFVDRPKQGFTVPKHRWLQSQPTEDLKASLLPDGIEAWLDPARLVGHVLETPRGLELAWPLLAFAHWYRRYTPDA